MPTGTNIVVNTSPATMSSLSHPAVYSRRVASPGNHRSQFISCILRLKTRGGPALGWGCRKLPSLGAPGPSHIVIAIDTSGSMSADMLSTIFAEIDTMRSVTETQLTLIDCNAAIQNAVTYKPWELTDIDLSRRTFKGRGGTDFRPVFEWIEGTAERGLAQPDALVYMTD